MEEKEIEKEIKLIEKRIRTEILTPEEIKTLQNKRLELIKELFEAINRSMLEEEEWEISWAKIFYNAFQKEGYDKEKATNLAISGVETMYDIIDEVKTLRQKEYEAKEFFRRNPKLLPKKKWYHRFFKR